MHDPCGLTIKWSAGVDIYDPHGLTWVYVRADYKYSPCGLIHNDDNMVRVGWFFMVRVGWTSARSKITSVRVTTFIIRTGCEYYDPCGLFFYIIRMCCFFFLSAWVEVRADYEYSPCGLHNNDVNIVRIGCFIIVRVGWSSVRSKKTSVWVKNIFRPPRLLILSSVWVVN